MKISMGKAIRILRQAKSLNTTELSKNCDISVPYLSLIERDARQPSLDVLGRIAKGLDVPIDVFISIGANVSLDKSSERANCSELIGDAVQELAEMETRLDALLSGSKNSAKSTRSNRKKAGGGGSGRPK
ncbi:helix-turn-helix domain-containing protein [Planctomycetes bacterium TBK1r]|uniref:helix-turn-helix domain-containing protein n=1 Tax=Stieleria magnilauensis TaxID=2527963 RepID=UPI00119E2648